MLTLKLVREFWASCCIYWVILLEYLLKNILVLFRFVKTVILDEVSRVDKQTAKDMANQVLKHFIHQTNHFVIQNCLSRFIPEKSSELVEYHVLFDDAQSFEKQVADLGTYNKQT